MVYASARCVAMFRLCPVEAVEEGFEEGGRRRQPGASVKRRYLLPATVDAEGEQQRPFWLGMGPIYNPNLHSHTTNTDTACPQRSSTSHPSLSPHTEQARHRTPVLTSSRGAHLGKPILEAARWASMSTFTCHAKQALATRPRHR